MVVHHAGHYFFEKLDPRMLRFRLTPGLTIIDVG